MTTTTTSIKLYLLYCSLYYSLFNCLKNNILYGNPLLKEKYKPLRFFFVKETNKNKNKNMVHVLQQNMYNLMGIISVDNIEEIIEKAHPGLSERVEKGMDNLHTTEDVVYLFKLYKELCLYNDMYRNYIRPYVSLVFSRLFDGETAITERVNILTPDDYKVTIVNMNMNEIVNGYELMGFNGYELMGFNRNYINYPNFLFLNDLWNGLYSREIGGDWIKHENPVSDLTKEKFMNLYNDIACNNNWYRINENGDFFVGFWNYPEGSIERENAGKLTHNKNGRCLWKLPFPKYFLLETIKIEHNVMTESVKYSNSIGVWMERKRAKIQNLQDIKNISIVTNKYFNNHNEIDNLLRKYF